MYWLFGSLFNNSSPDTVGPKLPHDFDEYQWWNPFDWAGNYDSSLSAYEARKRQGTIKNVMIGAGLFGAYWLFKKLK